VAVLAIGPAAVGAGTRHLPPTRTHAPRNWPSPGQTYATVVFGEGRVCEGANVGVCQWQVQQQWWWAVSLSVVAQLRLTACWPSGNLHYTVGHGRLLEVVYHRTSWFPSARSMCANCGGFTCALVMKVLWRSHPAHTQDFMRNIVPSVLWRCWLGGRKGIRPVKKWAVGCWCGYLSGVRCRLAYGPADATATHCLLLL